MKFLSLLVAAFFLLPCFSPNAEARHHHRHHSVFVGRSWHRPYHYSSIQRYGRFYPRYAYPQYHRRSAVSVQIGPFGYYRSGYCPGYYGPGMYNNSSFFRIGMGSGYGFW